LPSSSRRRGRAVRAHVRRLPAPRAPGRRRAALRDPAAAPLPAHRGGAAKAFSPKTKVALFNNPLNPTATIFSDDDLALLADFCIRFDAVAVCDEVWEHVVFDGRRHRPLMALPACASGR
jgi:hypothetical protein